MPIRTPAETVQVRDELRTSVEALFQSLNDFITNQGLTAPVAVPPAPALPNLFTAINDDITELNAIIGRITAMRNATNHTIAETNGIRVELERILAQINAYPLNAAQRVDFNNTVRPQVDLVQTELGDFQTGIVIGHFRNLGRLAIRGITSPVRHPYIAGGVVATGIAIAAGLPQKAGSAVMSLGQAQGIPSSNAGKGAPAHLANESKNKEASLQEIFNRLSVGGGIEAPEKQKFDNLFNAIQDATTSWPMEVITAGMKQGVRHLQKEVKYGGVNHTVDIWLTADHEGDDMHITISQLSFIHDVKSPDNGNKSFERTKRFKRNEDGGSLTLSIDDGQYRLSDTQEMDTELGKTSKFFGK